MSVNSLKYSIAVWIMLFHQVVALSQSLSTDMPPPEVGQAMPDYTFSDVRYYKSKTVHLHEFKGKWLFLDFWSPLCGTSASSLQKINAWQQEFKRNTMWLMVGMNNSLFESDIETFYEKMRVRKGLKLTVAFDSVLNFKWDIFTLPHIYIIDPKGIVRFITDGRDLNAEKIRSLVQGEQVEIYGAVKNSSRPLFEPNTINDQHPDVKDKILHRSLLMKWNGEAIRGGIPVDRWMRNTEAEKLQGYKMVGVPLYWLYNYAYHGQIYWPTDDPGYGEIYPIPVLELSDSSLFSFDMDGNGKYNYSLRLPPSTATRSMIMQYMQQDLANTFGFSVHRERRSFPVWKLIAKPGALEKLKTKGEKKSATPKNFLMGFTVKNYPPHALISVITSLMAHKYISPYIPFLDETGLEENFDLTMDADMDNMEDVRRELQTKGLDLVRSTKEMQVLVIREK